MSFNSLVHVIAQLIVSSVEFHYTNHNNELPCRPTILHKLPRNTHYDFCVSYPGSVCIKHGVGRETTGARAVSPTREAASRTCRDLTGTKPIQYVSSLIFFLYHYLRSVKILFLIVLFFTWLIQCNYIVTSLHLQRFVI